MNRTWHLPFRWVSDPAGERLAKPLDAWNPRERSGLFHPLVLLVAPDGRALVRHRSRDFADRRDDADVLEALGRLGLAPRPVPDAWSPEGVAPQPTEGAFRPDAFGPYFRGLLFGARALVGRMRDEQDAAEVQQTVDMAASFTAAWKERRTQGALETPSAT